MPDDNPNPERGRCRQCLGAIVRYDRKFGWYHAEMVRPAGHFAVPMVVA